MNEREFAELTERAERADRALAAGDLRAWRRAWGLLASEATNEQWVRFTEERRAVSGRKRQAGRSDARQERSRPNRRPHGRA